MKMNDKQRKLVEKNIHLAKDFINKNHLNYEEWIDIAYIGLCEAALNYDESKGKFSTHAFWKMRGRMKTEAYYMNASKRTTDKSILSLDKEIEVDGNKIEMVETVCGNCNTENEVVGKLSSEDILGRLTETQRSIVSELMNGRKQNEIANILGMSQQNVNAHVSRIRKKLSPEFRQSIC